MLHSSTTSPTPAVHAQFDRLLDVEGPLPDVHDHLDAARADILAFTTFPEATSGPRSGQTTPRTRLNREIRRRTDAVAV